MKQIHHPYWLWEDYKNGMYDTPCQIDEQMILNCMELLSPFALPLTSFHYRFSQSTYH
jgi:hypothetical protein